MALRTTTTEPVPLGEYVPEADRRIVLRQVGWQGYEALLAMRGESSRPRMIYLDGSVEIMTPSRHHERFKFWLGRLVETYMLELGISFGGYGSWTLKDFSREAGKEPDECYILGKDQSEAIERPHLAIEIVWTSGGLNTLEVYRRLRVPEVWYWKSDTISVHVLVGDAYEARGTSACLPGIDLALLCRLAHCSTVNEAVAQLKRELAARR